MKIKVATVTTLGWAAAKSQALYSKHYIQDHRRPSAELSLGTTLCHPPPLRGENSKKEGQAPEE